ncbi:hypothetical protein V6N13_071693 [Hibiscus sabdariffa]
MYRTHLWSRIDLDVPKSETFALNFSSNKDIRVADKLEWRLKSADMRVLRQLLWQFLVEFPRIKGTPHFGHADTGKSVPLGMKSYTSNGTSVSKQHPNNLRKDFSATTALDILTATNIPL